MKKLFALFVLAAALASGSVYADTYSTVPGTSLAAKWDTTTGTFVSIGVNGQPTSQTRLPTLAGTNNFTGTFEISGVAETFPASGLIVGTTDTQTLTHKTLTAPIIDGGASGSVIITTQSAVPTVTSCGNGPPAVIGTDNAGLIATGTGTPTTCDLVLKAPKSSILHCAFSSTTTGVTVSQLASTTTAQVNMAMSATTTGIHYICMQ